MQNKELQRLESNFNVDLSSLYDKYPVPVGEICDILGIKVIFDKQMDDSLHGKISYEEDKYFIRINDNHSAYNNIFTIAHELGHYLIHLEEVKKQGFADRKSNFNAIPCSYEERKKEREANNFAAELLMPEDKFVDIFSVTDGNLYALQEVFKVSLEAIEWRALNLGLILP